MKRHAGRRAMVLFLIKWRGNGLYSVVEETPS
jgi:hypothetical protein